MGTVSGFDWENMRIFLAVARSGSARGAAEGLGLHYTSITRRIAAFERQVGARLFDKSLNGYALTGHGQAVLKNAEVMENEAFAAERHLTGADEHITGELRVTMSTTIAAYLLVDGLRDFRQTYQDITLIVDTGYRFADFSRREADVTVRVSNDPGDQMVGRKFGTFHQSVYATPAYINRHPPSEEGSGCVWLNWKSREAFDKDRKKSAFPIVENYMQIEDEILLLEAAKAGMGIATLPCFYADKDPELVRISPHPPEPVLGVWLLTHPDLAKNARVRHFVDFFTVILKQKSNQLKGKISAQHQNMALR